MKIPGVGQLTALAVTTTIDDPERFPPSRDIGAYLGVVPLSGEVDQIGSILKVATGGAHPVARGRQCQLMRYEGRLKLKNWVFPIARRSTMSAMAEAGVVEIVLGDVVVMHRRAIGPSSSGAD